MPETIRTGDVARAGAAMFLLGTFVAASGWNVGGSFLLLYAVGIAVAMILRSQRAIMVIIAAIAAFSLSVFYYYAREGSVAGVNGNTNFVFAPPASATPVAGSALFDAALPYSQASLLTGLFGGSASVLAPGLKAAMERSGTAYIVGMYGYKIHLLAKGVFAALKRFLPRRAAIFAVLLVIAAFVASAGAPTSAVRAGIMVALASLAELSGRRFDSRAALLFTAFAMVLIDPSAWGSAGFLLSFMSLVGIYVLAPSLETLFAGKTGRKKGKGILSWRSHLAMTVAVNLAILPIVAVSYGQFPLISFASNFFIALPFGAVLFLGIALVGAASVVPFASFAIAPALAALLSYQLAAVGAFAITPFMVPAAAFPPMVIAAYYFALALCAYRFSTPR